MKNEKPRLWPALLVGIGVVPFLWGCWLLLLGLELLVEPLPVGELFEENSSAGFFATSVVGEVFLVILLLWIARRSRENPWQRFALGPSRLSLWILPVVFFGDLAAGFIGGTLQALLFDGASELDSHYRDVVAEGVEGSLLAFLLVMAVLPAISEELLFRGYVQSRLLQRLPAGVAILISSLLFAAAHGEVQYALMVFPVGLWLGFVAYLAGSIWPSMISHFCSNGLIVLVAWLTETGEEGAAVEELTEGASMFEFILPSLVLLVCAKVLRWRQGRQAFVLPLDATRLN